MDADYLMQVVKPKDGNSDIARNYMLSSGMTSSALEHGVPEQLFSTPDAPVEGISTVKAIKIANDQGIPIYTVNQNNIATTLPQLQIDRQVKDDITNAVNAGKVVTVSKANINFNGWNGCGYIITNPETGGGAYMISGGTNGADDDGNKAWGVLDSFALVISVQFAAMLKLIEKKANASEVRVFDVIAKKIGVIISVTQWFGDLNEINGKPIKDEWQWLSAYLAISSSLLLGVAISLAIPATAPVWLAIGVTILATIAINLIKTALLEYILEAKSYFKNRYEV